MAFSLKSKLALSEINCERRTEYSYLKPLQINGIRSAVLSDTFIILPTGYGKSLIFEMIPRINRTKAVIISPLNAIIEEQTGKLSEKALHVTSKLAKDLTAGEYNRSCNQYTCM